MVKTASILMTFLISGINFRHMEKHQSFHCVIIRLFPIAKSYLIGEIEQHKDGFNDEVFRRDAKRQ